METLECPTRREMRCTGTPAPSAAVMFVCRSSCRLTRGKPVWSNALDEREVRRTFGEHLNPVDRQVNNSRFGVSPSWFTLVPSVRRGLVAKWLVASGIVSFLFFTLRAVNPLGLDIDTVFLLELPRTNADDWFRTFATSAHPFGVISQHLYLDLMEVVGVHDFTAWKVAIGSALLIPIAYLLKSFGTGVLINFFCSVAIFPSLWRNLLALEEEIIGASLFGFSAFLLIRATSLEGADFDTAEITDRKLQYKERSIHLSLVVTSSAASLWHFQYWYILSVTLVFLSFRAFCIGSNRRKEFLLWSSLTAAYFPLFHLLGIIRPTGYHRQWPSLPSHLSDGDSIASWFGWVIRGFFWHGTPYINDGVLPFLFAALVGSALLGLYFCGRKIGRNRKAVMGVLLASSLSLPTLYEPNSSERWVPFWTLILICGVIYFGSEQGPTGISLSSNSASVPDSASEVEPWRASGDPRVGRCRILVLVAMFAFASYSSATWHGNFSSSHLSNWSEMLKAERCSEDLLTSTVSPYLDGETLVIVGHAYGLPGKSSQSPIDQALLNFLASLPRPESTHLIVAGDLMESPSAESILRQGDHLRSLLKEVYLAPGNHDLWDAYSEQYLHAGFNSPGVYSVDRLTLVILDSTSKERTTNVLDDVGVVSDGVMIVTHHVVQFDGNNQDSTLLRGHNLIDQKVFELELVPMDESGHRLDVIAVHGDAGLHPTRPLQCQRATSSSAILSGLGGTQLDRVLVVRNLEEGARACFLSSSVESCFGKGE